VAGTLNQAALARRHAAQAAAAWAVQRAGSHASMPASASQ